MLIIYCDSVINNNNRFVNRLVKNKIINNIKKMSNNI